MGYRSSFNLTITKKDKSGFTESEAKAIISELSKLPEVKPDDQQNFGTSIEVLFDDIKWTESEQNFGLKAFSKEHDVIIKLHREGEDHDDIEDAIYMDGEYFGRNQVKFIPPFKDEGKKVVLLTLTNTRRARLMAVTQEELENSLPIWSERGFNPVVLDSADIFGTNIEF